MDIYMYDPQSRNRYTYARNDPINKIDVGGLYWKCTSIGKGNTWKNLESGETGRYYEICEWIPEGRSLAQAQADTRQRSDRDEREAQIRNAKLLDALEGATKLAQDEEGDCRKFLNKVFNYAINTLGMSADRANVEGLLEAMLTAVYDLFGSSSNFSLGDKGTVADQFKKDSNIKAIAYGRHVFLGDGFFKRGHNRVGTVLHEGFHVSYYSDIMKRVVGLGLTDPELAKAVGVYDKDENASEKFTGEMGKHCK